MPIDWRMWTRNRGHDLRTAEKMFSAIDREDYSRCQLCEQRVPGWKRAEHHAAHMAALDFWQANGGANDERSSRQRVESRRAQRRREIEQAEAFGKDSYLYAVTRVEQLGGNRSRAVARRRLRHPRRETEARVLELLDQGRMPAAIAAELNKTEDYIRRIIRSLGWLE